MRRVGVRVGRFLIFVGFVLVALVAIVLIAPGFINWNTYRDQIAKAAGDALGREVKIEGDVAFTILPRPALSLAEVSVANTEGAERATFLSVDRIDSQLELTPLLRGQVQVTSFYLEGAQLDLERGEDGTANWALVAENLDENEKTPSTRDRVGRLLAGAIQDVRVDNLSVDDLSITFSDHASDEHWSAIVENATLAVASLVGPFEGIGRVAILGRSFDIEAKLGRIDSARPIPLTLEASGDEFGTQFSLNGFVLNEGEARQVSGRMKLQANQTEQVLTDLSRLANIDLNDLMGRKQITLPISAEGGIILTGDDFSAINLDLSIGQSVGQTNAQITLGETVKGEVSFKGQMIDLDELTSGKPIRGRAGDQTSDEISRDTGLKPVDIRLAIASEKAKYNDGLLEDIDVRMQISETKPLLMAANANLPGGTAFSLERSENAQMPIEGSVTLESQNARSLFKWLGLEVGNVPQNRLRNFALTGDMSVSEEAVHLSSVSATLDRIKAQGDFIRARSKRLSFSARMTANALNLTGHGIKSDLKSLGSFLNGFDANLDISTEFLTGFGVTNAAANIKMKLQAGRADIEKFTLTRKGEFDADLKGTLSVNPTGSMDGDVSYSLAGVFLCAESLGKSLLSQVCAGDKQSRLAGKAHFNKGEADLTATGSLGNFDLTGTIQGGQIFWQRSEPAVLEFTGRLAGADLYLRGQMGRLAHGYDIQGRLAADAFDAVPFMKLFNIPYTADKTTLAPLTATSEIALTPSNFILSEMQVSVGEQMLAGNLEYQSNRAASVLLFALTGNNIDLSDFVDRKMWTLHDRGRAWSTVRFKSSLPPALTGSFDLNLANTSFHGQSVEAFRALGAFENSAMEVHNLGLKLWGGEWTGSGALGLGAGLANAKIALIGENVSLNKASAFLFGNPAVSGQGKVNINLTATGQSPFGLVSTLSGLIEVGSTQGAMEGFDLAGFNSAIAQARTPSSVRFAADESLSGGRTRFSKFDARFTITDGYMDIVNLQSDMVGGDLAAQGRFDLGARTLGGNATINVDGDSTLPPVGLSVSGPIWSTVRQWNLNDLEAEIVSRFPDAQPSQSTIGEQDLPEALQQLLREQEGTAPTPP